MGLGSRGARGFTSAGREQRQPVRISMTVRTPKPPIRFAVCIIIRLFLRRSDEPALWWRGFPAPGFREGPRSHIGRAGTRYKLKISAPLRRPITRGVSTDKRGELDRIRGRLLGLGEGPRLRCRLVRDALRGLALWLGVSALKRGMIGRKVARDRRASEAGAWCEMLAYCSFACRTR